MNREAAVPIDEHLEREIAPEVGVVPFQDHAHAAVSYLLADFISGSTSVFR